MVCLVNVIHQLNQQAYGNEYTTVTADPVLRGLNASHYIITLTAMQET